MGTAAFSEIQGFSDASIITDASPPGYYETVSSAVTWARVDTFIATSDDTVDHVLTLQVVVNGSNVPIGQVTLPAGAGMGAGPSIDLLAAVNPATQVGVLISPNGGFGFILDASPSSGKTLTALAQGGML